MNAKTIVKVLAAGGAFVGAQRPAVARLEYGRYLAEEGGKRQTRRSPVTDSGELDIERSMKGAVPDFQPLKPVEGWHKTSPDITSGGRLWERWGDRLGSADACLQDEAGIRRSTGGLPETTELGAPAR